MKDLSILIQGPFFEFENFNSNNNIEILKKVFPESDIIISTWENESRFSKNEKHKIIFNKDPGFVRDQHLNSATSGSNILRQITSVKNGLKEIKSKYTLKIRSDCYFNSNKILNLNLSKFLKNKKYSFLKERIITSSVGSLNQLETKILYHYSDWFNFGLTEDLNKLWTNVIIEDDDINFFSRFFMEKRNIYGKDWDLKYTAEQFIYYKSISHNLNNELIHAHDFSKNKLVEAENYLINNFYLVDPDDVGFVFPKYDEKINKKLKINNTNIRSKELVFLSYNNDEWLKLYNKKNKIKHIPKKNLNKKFFRLKFKIKNFLYKYFKFLNCFFFTISKITIKKII